MMSAHNCWIVLALTSLAFAGIGNAAGLDILIPSVDVVVDGTATDQTDADRQNSIQGDRRVQIVPMQVFKGRVPGPVDATWRSPWVLTGGVGATAGSLSLPTAEGLWFLKEKPDGVYEIVAARGGRSPWGKTYFRLGRELPEALRVPAQSFTDELILEIAAGEAADASQDSVGQTWTAAGRSDSPAIRAALQYLSGIERSRANALAGLIDRSDVTAFNTFLRDLGTYTPTELYEFAVVIDAAFRSTSPTVIDALANLVFGPNTPDAIRPAAAQALRSIHTQATLPYLAQMLESADMDMRQRAVFGFSGFANGLPMTTPENARSGEALSPDEHAPFKTKDTMRYFALPVGLSYAEQEPAVKFWRDWWKSHRSQLGF